MILIIEFVFTLNTFFFDINSEIKKKKLRVKTKRKLSNEICYKYNTLNKFLLLL